jgi:hypothetical protein
MLNKKGQFFFLFSFLLINLLSAQTAHWRLIWTKNAETDTVDYYVVYRNENSAPSSGDSIAMVQHPSNAAQDSVVYVDNQINRGIHYYYNVIAVDYKARRSSFSESVHAAIPQIRFSTLTLQADASVPIDLNNDQYVRDPDNNFSELSWSVIGGTQISAQINNDTKVVTFTTPSDTNIQEDFEFTVTDPDGFVDVRSVTVSLSAAPAPNQNPSINSTPPQMATVGSPYEYIVAANDADGDPLTFSLTTGPNFLNISNINNSSATISGTPSENDVAQHTVTVRASDGKGGIADQSYELTVQSQSSSEMVSNVTHTNFGTSIVRITWDTREETRDKIRYDINTNYQYESSQDDTYLFNHERILSELLPNTTYHFQIVSQTAEGLVSYSPDYTFTTEEGTDINVFPIPYIAGELVENDGITFVNLPVSSSISIYNLIGDLIFKAENLTHVYTWPVKNNANNMVNAGLYIYYVKDESGNRVDSGKLIIVR